MRSNFSLHVNNDVDSIKFLVLNQNETYCLPLIGISMSNNGFVALFVLLILLSLPGNMAIFTAVFRNGLKDRPVNLLIFIDQLINSVQRYQMSLMHLYILTNINSSLGEYFCHYSPFLHIFGVLNTTLGSVPIAAFRLIAINKPLSRRMKFFIATSLLVTGLMINIFMTWTIGTTAFFDASLFKAVCLGRSEQFAEIMMDYTRSTWLGPIYMVQGTTASLHCVEGIIYIYIFWYIYEQERTVRPMLSEKLFKIRRKRNALSMISQFYIYVIEQMLMFIIFMMTVSKVKPGIWLAIAVQFEFTTRCSVQALASAETRQEFIFLIGYIKRISKADKVGPSTVRNRVGQAPISKVF